MEVAALEEAVPRGGGNMKNIVKKILTEEEQQKITETVQKMEKKTSGEIVPMVVSASGDYPLASVVCGAFFSLPFSLLFTHWVGERLWLGPQNMYLFLVIFLFLFTAIFFCATRMSSLKSFFLSTKQVEKAVQESALAAFYSEKLYKTAQENGILIYVSLYERKVWILADHGINEKIEQTVWDSIVVELALGIKEGNCCEAICSAVEGVGNILKEHFPYQKDDEDELHNLIIR